MYRLNNRIQSVILLLIITLGLASIAFGIKIHPAKPARAATTYTVTTNADSGVGSLRQAIIDANANPGADVIVFNAAMTIQPTSALPDITDPVEINGYTGSPGGATPNTAVSPNPFNGTLTIELDGTSAGTANGLTFVGGSDLSVVSGLVINNFALNGIELSLNSNIRIVGNYIGTDTAGTVDAGNTSNGVYINTSSHNNAVGGISAADRNVISGNNNDGVTIGDPGSTSNTVLGNYIGLKADGSAISIGNSSNGVSIFSSADENLVGGTAATSKNVISGNNNGVYISSASSNTISGNYIGTRYTGIAAQTNTAYGVLVDGFSSSTTIGGTVDITVDGPCTGACNVISGNSSDGVSLTGANVTGTIVEGNYIGTDVNGAINLGNTSDGVEVGSGAYSNSVGGANAESRNIISGNGQSGVYLSDSSHNNTVAGNYIGTDVGGTNNIGNTTDGIHLQESDSNTIGGTSGVALGGNCTGSCNLISGNGGDGIGILFNSDSNIVEGNFVGVDVSGATAISNASDGVAITHSSESNTIGGTTAGSRNIISGNSVKGVNTEDSGTDNNVILGNYIGTDTTGTSAIGNNIGVGISGGSGNIVGGTTAGSRNIISGSTSSGIALGGDAIVQGNYIGLNANGDGVLANATSGANIGIFGGSNNIIGGSTQAARNVISGPSIAEIQVIGGTAFGGGPSNGNKIQGNYIGTDATGAVRAGFGSTKNAVIFVFDAQNNLVGGANSGEGNLIAGNSSGVGVSNFSSFEALNNSILGNSIYDNTGGSAPSNLGIDLLGSTVNGTTFTDAGVTPNDAGDTDELSNHLMNFPVIQSITSTNGTATVTYNLDINDAEAGATGYRVEFFANDSADPSGNGQGQTYLGSDTVSGDVTGRQATITLPAGVDGSKYITATTTMTDNSSDGFGHSSEFAANLQATLVPASTPSGGSSSIANTGQAQNNKPLIIIASVLIALGAIGIATLAVTKIRKRKLR